MTTTPKHSVLEALELAAKHNSHCGFVDTAWLRKKANEAIPLVKELIASAEALTECLEAFESLEQTHRFEIEWHERTKAELQQAREQIKGLARQWDAERDGAKYTLSRAESSERRVKELEAQYAGAIADIHGCIEYANNRQSEWGDRALGAFEYLHHALSNLPRSTQDLMRLVEAAIKVSHLKQIDPDEATQAECDVINKTMRDLDDAVKTWEENK